MFIFGIIFYLVAAVAAASLLCVVGSGIVTLCRKVFTKNDVKLAVIAAIFIIIILCVAISPAASRAEELLDGFYYKVVFIDEVEEQEEELLIHTDDLDNLWDFWEDYPEEDEDFFEYAFDEELSNIVLHFCIDNQIEAAFNKEDRIIRGRLIVLTMWEATEDPWDDEVVDVYYSELVTW